MMLSVSLSPGQETISWSRSSAKCAISGMSCCETRGQELVKRSRNSRLHEESQPGCLLESGEFDCKIESWRSDED